MEPVNKPAVIQRRSILSQLKLRIDPDPVEEPKVHPGLIGMHALERAVEVSRYSVLRLEWWLSPGGALREWLRFNLLLGMVLTIPALLVVPVITYVLGQFATWTALLVQIARNLIVFPLFVIIGIALVSALLTILRQLGRR